MNECCTLKADKDSQHLTMDVEGCLLRNYSALSQNGFTQGMTTTDRGAVSIVGSKAVLYCSNSTFIGNTAAEGGALAVDQGASVNLTNYSMAGNAAISGGAISSTNNARVYISFGDFAGNQGLKGGAVHSSGPIWRKFDRLETKFNTHQDHTLDIHYTQFLKNHAEDSVGAVFVQGYSFRCTGCNFNSNIAGSSGGAIASTEMGMVVLTKVTFSSNRATIRGGVLLSGSFVGENLIFAGNTATSFGAKMSAAFAHSLRTSKGPFVSCLRCIFKKNRAYEGGKNQT